MIIRTRKDRRRAVVVALFLAIALLTGTVALATDINVTVTPAWVGVSVDPSTVDYDVVALGGSAVSGTVYATNTGNSSANFSISGADATATGSTWTLSPTNGASQYVHAYSTDGSPYTPLTTGGQILASGVGGGGSQAFTLQITMPTSTASNDPHSTTVTVVATM